MVSVMFLFKLRFKLIFLRLNFFFHACCTLLTGWPQDARRMAAAAHCQTVLVAVLALLAKLLATTGVHFDTPAAAH